MWTYDHVVSLRRISTPHNLGAAVRDARTAAQLTQAELAERAGVSREWLIGLERGTRPRAELTKILGVLSALDQPIMLGHEQKLEAPESEPEPPHSGNAMTTAEITRRAIERSRQPSGAASSAASAAAAATALSAMSTRQLVNAMPNMDFTKQLASMAPKTDLSSLMRKTDFSALMPQPSPALQGLMRELSTASSTARDDRSKGDHDVARAVDSNEDPDDADGGGQLW